MPNVERELKLVPPSEAFLDQLAQLETFGPFAVTGHRHEIQHNSFFDNRSRTLGGAGIGFRRRTVEGERLATWTIKADGNRERKRGVAVRTEIELQLDADLAPALALDALKDAARSRGAPALAGTVSDALASGGLPQAQPILETVTDRRILDLEAPDGARVELALDHVQMVGHAHDELEIEAELKRGNEAVLDKVREAIASLGPVTESHGSKLSRALEYLATLDR